MSTCPKHGLYSTFCRACDLDVIKKNEMKLSEAIRNAVDNHLASNNTDFREEVNKFLTLMWVLKNVVPDEELQQIDAEEHQMLAMMPYDLNERQNLRFMYAEFLALEAEDNEALEEIRMDMNTGFNLAVFGKDNEPRSN